MIWTKHEIDSAYLPILHCRDNGSQFAKHFPQILSPDIIKIKSEYGVSCFPIKHQLNILVVIGYQVVFWTSKWNTDCKSLHVLQVNMWTIVQHNTHAKMPLFICNNTYIIWMKIKSNPFWTLQALGNLAYRLLRQALHTFTFLFPNWNF